MPLSRMINPHELFARNVPGSTEALQNAAVGLAGCGGLGSNVAVALARAGIGKLILADYDRVELSNLNRQHYFLSDVGKYKTEALSDHLRNINPQIKIELFIKKLAPADIITIFGQADVLIEAFDRAEAKQWLIETWSKAFPSRPIIVGNGLAGLGATESLIVRRMGHIWFCGDGFSDANIGLSAPRVGIVAMMQANVAIELLGKESHDTGQRPR